MMKIRAFSLLVAVSLCFTTARAQEATKPPVTPQTIHGIENFFSLSTNVYSGSSPHDVESFAALQKLGIKTIISVDGGKPDVEGAAKYGIKYVHLPIGYDGTTQSNALNIVRAAQLADGAVFVHCHHGKHRGPAAAALICQGLEGWSTNQALGWLKTAGTSPDYKGLFQMASDFKTPTKDELAKLPASYASVAVVSGLVDGMVAIDANWDHLKAVQKAGYGPDKNHPDIDPPHEATMMWEALRELQRSQESKDLGDDFMAQLAASEKAAEDIRQFLKENKAPLNEATQARAKLLWDAMGATCSKCHKQYRN